MNYKDMTIEQLEAENIKLMAEKEAVRQKQVELNAVMSSKIAEIEARKKFDAMPDAERQALNRIISNAGNIASGEVIGTP
jgi:predicted RecB family endonuclease